MLISAIGSADAVYICRVDYGEFNLFETEKVGQLAPTYLHLTM